MLIDIGIPVHGNPELVLNSLHNAKIACDSIHAAPRFIIANDFSDPADIAQIQKGAKSKKYNLHIIDLHNYTPGPNPNLALAVGLLLDSVAPNADLYLNMESDVLLHPATLLRLLIGMEETGCSWAFPMQLTPGGDGDFVFWGVGTIPYGEIPPILEKTGRPKWCNLGCLLMRGDMARDQSIRPDPVFKLFCVDTDYTAALAQKYTRPLYWPNAKVTHIGRQSSKEGQGIYDHLLAPAVRAVDTKWAHYLPGGPF